MHETKSANMQIGDLYYKCCKAKEKLESQKKICTAGETMSLHLPVKELERDGKSNFWFLDRGKNLSYRQAWKHKTQTHPPTEGMNFSYCMISLRKDFNRGSARAWVCGQIEPGRCLFWEGVSLLSWELLGRSGQVYRLLSIVKERCDLVILEDLVNFDWLGKLLKVPITKSYCEKNPWLHTCSRQEIGKDFPWK